MWAVTQGSVAAQEQGPGLFTPLGPARDDASPAEADGPEVPTPRATRFGHRSVETTTGRLVRVDVAQLESLRGQLARGVGVPLNLNLATDITIDAVFDTTQATQGGYTLSGRVPQLPDSTVVFAVRGSVVAGIVHAAGRVWAVESLGPGVYAIRRVTEPLSCSTRPLSEAPAVFPASGRRWTTQASGAEDDGSEIDVLVLFTTAVRRRHGFERVLADIDLAVAAANTAYADGGAVQRLNLVAAVETSYEESTEHGHAGLDSAVDLDRLTKTDDGYLDEVHRLRDQYAADVVYLLYPGASGRAWVLDPSGTAGDEAWKGFALGRTQPDLALTFTHELGHLMGMLHERFEGTSEDVHPYAYGYVNQLGLHDDQPDSRRWNTIMAYGVQCWTLNLACMQLMRFSNPDQLYPASDGDPMGVHGNEHTEATDGPADAVRNLNETRGTVANFRPSEDRCEYAIGDRELVVGPDGADLLLSVTAEDRCEWDVRVFEGFLTAEVESGAGDGSVAVQVQSNEGGARIGYVTIAGETLVVKQRSEVPLVSVCDRSTHVGDAIMATVGQDSCDSIDEFDLLSVVELDLAYRADGLRFEPTDLSGLGALAVFRADGNGIEELPAGLFDGLTSLETVRLSFNSIPDLPSGMFGGLANLRVVSLHGNRFDAVPTDGLRNAPSLEILKLGGNQIRRIDAEALDGLTGLRELDLGVNEQLVAEAGAFEAMTDLMALGVGGTMMELSQDVLRGLSNLRHLGFPRSDIESIPTRAFSGSPRLETLYLDGNAITSLAEGSFDGLGELSLLDLGENPLGDISERAFSDTPLLAGLHLDSTELVALPAGLFDGLDILWRLDLGENGLQDLSGVRLPGPAIGVVDFAGNELASLPSGMFDRFTSESCYGGDLTLDLRDNPGAPFALAPLLERVDGGAASAGPASVVLVLPQGAPVPVELEIETGSDDAGWHFLAETTIANGERRSEPVKVNESGRATLRVRDPSGSGLPVTIRGMRVAGGESIVLFGFEDRALAAGTEPFVLDLAEAFAQDGTDGTARTFSAASSDAAVAAVSLADGSLTVTPLAGGSATITITVGEPDGTQLVRSFVVDVEAATPPAESDPRSYAESIPYFPSAGDPDVQGFVRVINHANEAGEVSIDATDDAGTANDPITLIFEANETVHFNSDDLETGNDAKGLSGGVGQGEWDWRLEISGDPMFEALSYLRTRRDGFLTAMMGEVPRIGNRHRVPVFNPGSNTNQASRLRFVNYGAEAVEVEVLGIDDGGRESTAAVTVPANGATTVTAAELESAGLGDGQGKWQLVLSADGPLTVMNLMSTPTGHVTNLSEAPRLPWRGLVVEPESRCPDAPYDRDEYGTRYQGTEDDIVDGVGGIFGPYTGTCYESTADTTIEHIVALQEAHFSGMCLADTETKRTFAGDLLNLALASAEVDSAKDSLDAFDWMPETNRCWFAKRVLDVRLKYGMTIDREEAEALELVLAACDNTDVVPPACADDG